MVWGVGVQESALKKLPSLRTFISFRTIGPLINVLFSFGENSVGVLWGGLEVSVLCAARK